MIARTFVDSNVLVYASDASNPERRQVAAGLIRELALERKGLLSTQVLQETYYTLTRKIQPRMSGLDARSVLRRFEGWTLVTVDRDLIFLASELEEKHQLNYWDALILAAASRGGAERLVSEDFSDGRTFEGVRVENPFRFAR